MLLVSVSILQIINANTNTHKKEDVSMTRSFLSNVILMITLAVFLSACAAGKKYYQLGLQLQEAGKYKEAIAYLEQALNKEPKNKKYQNMLNEIKRKLIHEYINQARTILDASDQLTIDTLNRAKDKLAQAQEIDPEAADVLSLENEISSLENKFLFEIKQTYSQAKQAMTEGKWDEAYFLLQQVQSKFPNYEDSSRLLLQCSREGSKAFFNQASDYFKQENFKQAISFLRKALALDSAFQPARELLSQAQENDTKKYFLSQAREAVMAQNWDRAVQAYKRALEYDPADKDLKQLIAYATLKAGDYYIHKARTDIQNGWLLKAVDSYQLAKKYLLDEQDYKLNSLKQTLTARLRVIGDHFKEQNQYGAAWYWYQKIKQIDPDYPEIFFLIQAMEDNIRHRVQKSIAVFDFNSPSDNPDAGIIVANNLITFLFNNASGDIKILERENLKSILEEMKLGQIGVVSAQTAKEMGRIYGIDVAIMGSVLLFKVDSTISKGIKTVRYQVGTKIEDNIDYLNWKAKHPKPSEKELAQAPPAKIVIPEYAEKDYEVAKHKKVGFVQLSFRIVDIATGENIQVRTIERKRVVEDEASAGLAEANVKYDPLELPTDTELLQSLTSEVVAELGREVLRPLRNLEQTYFQEGEKLLRRRQNLDAAEKFIDAVFDERLKRITTPVTAKSLNKVEEIFRKYQIQLGG